LDKLIVMCDPKKNVNLEDQPIEELRVETYINCKLEYEDQDSIHQDNQDPISNDYTFEQDNQDSIDKNFILEQENQDSTHLDDKNSTHHDDQDSLNILPHSIQYEASIKFPTRNFIQRSISIRVSFIKPTLLYGSTRKSIHMATPFLRDGANIFGPHSSLTKKTASKTKFIDCSFSLGKETTSKI
jgi:hypothetical protein